MARQRHGTPKPTAFLKRRLNEVIMIRFIFGAPGSGKTHRVFEILRECPDNSFLIVPEQQTVVAERLALERLPFTAQLGFEVLNFTRLANRVFRRYGGLSYHYINPSMRSLFMWKTLKELSPMLEEYSQTGGELSLTPLMLNAADELTVNSITPAMLENAALKLPDSPLKRKLRDLSMIVSAYRGLVDESFDDRNEDLKKLADLLDTHSFFKGSEVFIDSFTSFTSLEYGIIERIFRQAENVTITLGCESPKLPLICTESIRETAKKLLSMAKKLGKPTDSIFLTDNQRINNEELRRLTTEFWMPGDANFDEIPENERGNIRIISCADQYDEANAVTSLILSELRRGLRYRDIAVVARDASRYEGIIDAALENAGIPYFMSKKNDLSSMPEMRILISALRIKYLGFRQEDVLSYLKTGLCGLSLRDIDMFEEYIETWNIAGERFTASEWSMNPDGYTDKLSARGQKILSAANRVREDMLSQLMPLFARLDAAEKLPEALEAIYDFLKKIDLPGQIAAKAESLRARGQLRAASDAAAVWGIIIDMLDDLAVAFPDERLDDEELCRALLICIKEAKAGSIPTGSDEVTVGSASLLRTGEIKTAILIGLNEGVFPASLKDNGVFNDSDRRELSSVGIELSDADGISRAAEEMLYARRAMTLPSDRLIMLYGSRGSDGKEARPSMLITRMKTAFPYLKTEIFACGAPEDRVTDLRSSVSLLKRFGSDTEFSRALEEELSAHGIDLPDSRIAIPDCSVCSDTAAMINGKHMSLSQTRIDSFVECGFAYYCDYALKLRKDEKATVDYKTSGTFIHTVLERFLREAVTENGLDLSDPAKIIDSVISEQLTAIATPEQRRSDRFRHLFTRLRRLAVLMAESLRREFAASAFRPFLFEYRLGDGGADPIRIKLSDGSDVSLSGCIDRVDLWRDGKEVYVRVVDYKTGSKKFSLDDIKSGLNLQLLIYLFTLCRPDTDFAREVGCSEGKAPIPAAANYLSSYLTTISTTGLPDEASITETALGRLDRSGVFLDDAAVLAALGSTPKQGRLDRESFDILRKELYSVIEALAEELRSGKASADPRIQDGKSPCNFCSMNLICRSARKTRT